MHFRYVFKDILYVDQQIYFGTFASDLCLFVYQTMEDQIL